MFLGLDLGTSAVKALLVDVAGHPIASQSAPLSVSRPHQGWSEQDPDSCWQAADMAVRREGSGCSMPELVEHCAWTCGACKEGRLDPPLSARGSASGPRC